jgi:hypothetical protein
VLGTLARKQSCSKVVCMRPEGGAAALSYIFRVLFEFPSDFIRFTGFQLPDVATCCGVLPSLASSSGPLLKDRSFRISKTGILEAWRLSEWVNWASVAPQVFIRFSGFQRPKARNVWRPVADLASTSSSFLKDRNFRLFESSRLGYLASWADWPSLAC